MSEASEAESDGNPVTPAPAARRVLDRESFLRRQNEVLLELGRARPAQPSDLGPVLRRITEAAAETLEVERASVWVYDRTRASITCLDLYERLRSRHSEGAELAQAKYPAYFQALEEQRAIAAHDARADPRTREFLADYLEPLGIVSMLDAPIRLQGKTVGVVCHEQIGPPRQWSIEEELFAGAIADLVSLCLEEHERGRAEEQVSAQRRWLDDLIRSVPGVVWETRGRPGSAGQKTDFVSDYAETMTGYPVSEWLARPDFWLALVPPEDREQAAAESARIFDSGRGGSHQFRWLTKDGRVLWAEAHSVVIGDASGQPVGMRGVTMDITERKLAERRLAAQHAVAQVLASASLEDAPPRIMQAICEHLNWDIGALWFVDAEAGCLCRARSWHAPGAAFPEFEAASERLRFSRGVGLPGRVWESGEPHWITDVLADTNFPRRPYAAREGLRTGLGFPIRIGGRVIGVMEIFSREMRPPDEQLLKILAPLGNQIGLFIERKQSETVIKGLNQDLELRVAERTEALREINEQMEAFCYSVSHDLRAPLRAMQGFSQALLEDNASDLDNTGRDYCRRIIRSAQQMDSLIQDLLAYSRLSRLELKFESVDLNRIAERLLIAFEPELREKQAEIQIDRPLPAVTGHYAVTEQVLRNLLSNALKFVPAGACPRVRVRAEQKPTGARVWVEDNGIGIAPEHHSRIFRVFERLHPVDVYPGTGIGLAIVRKAMERMGGQVGVRSAENAGSQFWVEFPT